MLTNWEPGLHCRLRLLLLTSNGANVMLQLVRRHRSALFAAQFGTGLA
jgi:hypothetical protein